MIANEALPLCRTDQNSYLKPVYYATGISQYQSLFWLAVAVSVAKSHASNLIDPLLISVVGIKLNAAVCKVVFACSFCFVFVSPLFIIGSSRPRFYHLEPLGDKKLGGKSH